MLDKSKVAQVHIGDVYDDYKIVDCVIEQNLDKGYKGRWTVENLKTHKCHDVNGSTILARISYQKGRKIGRPPKRIHKPGDIIGNWQIISEGIPYQNKTNNYTRKTWICKCLLCNNEFTVLDANLCIDSNKCKYCSLAQNADVKKQKNIENRKVIIGSMYGNYKILQEINHISEDDDENIFLCECQCELKTKKEYTGRYLRNVIQKNNASCNKPGCITNNKVIYHNGIITHRKCNICGEIVPIENMRKTEFTCLKCKPYSEAYYKTFRDKATRYIDENYNRYKKSARARNYDFELTKEDFKEIITQPCFYCGRYSRKSKRGCGDLEGEEINFCGIDRVNNAKGYYKDNTVPCCNICNLMKQKRNVYLWMDKIQEIINRKEVIFEGLNEMGINREDFDY